jgi:small-conductance mechanosensitive channel
MILVAQVVDTSDWLAKLIVSLGALVVATIVWFLLRWLLGRWINKRIEKLQDGDLAGLAAAQRLGTLAATIEKLVLLLLVVIVVVYLMLIWGIPIAPLIAGMGVIGVAVGFGAQDLVKDVIAGFFVLIEDQYAIGDVVELSGVSGTVEEIRLRTTVLRALDGAVHHVPNGEVRVSTNLTPDYSRVVIDIGVSYDADVDAAIAAIGDEASTFQADPEWAAFHVEAPEVLGVNELGDSAVQIRMMFPTHPERRWAVKREFLRRVKYRLDGEGIEIAYPHLQIVSDGDQA